jgi:hypothetical protein
MGTTTEEKNLFNIAITKAVIPSNVCSNDLENSIIGATTVMQWNIEGTDTWTDFEEKPYRFEGDVTVNIRIRANGTQLQSDEAQFTFTEDNLPETKKYIYISDLSLTAYSSAQSTAESAANVIDGRKSTIWHTVYNGSDEEKSFTIKIDSPRYISEIWYVPRQDGSQNGRPKKLEVYTSMDGEKWTLSSTLSDLANNATNKVITFDEPIETSYIKIKVPETYGGSYASAAMINLFEDATKRVTPVAGIEYSTEELTNEDVTVKLVNPSTEITITNNDGSDTYTFTENGEFTFEFADELGHKGTATAKVDWIDKKVPNAKITYNVTEETANNVIAEITFDEENVKVTNNFDGNTSYVFTENGEFTFEFEDEAGNKGTATATVTWIKAEDIVSEKYSIDEEYILDVTPDTTIEEFVKNVKTNQDVVFTDNQGNVLEEDAIIGTGTVLKVGDSSQYEIIVIGDTDGDGKNTINDLAQIKLHYTEKKLLEGAYLKAADVDTDRTVTINDIAKIKLILIN